MVKLRELLNEKKLRVVPFKTEKLEDGTTRQTSTLSTYKDFPFVDYRDYYNQKVALVNTGKDDKAHAMYIRNDVLRKSGTTLVAVNDTAIVLKPKVVPDEFKQGVSRARYAPVVLDQKTLDTDVVLFEAVKHLVKPASFAHLATLYESGEKLSRKELISLLTDERAFYVYSIADISTAITDSVFHEYFLQTTVRVRLLRKTRTANGFNNEVLGLFTEDEQRIFNKAVTLA